MRLLHTIASVDPRGGGPTAVVHQLGTGLNSLGVTSIVASLDAPTPTSWQSDFPFELHPLGPTLSAYGYSRHFTSWLRSNADTFDCVIVHGIWQFHALATWFLVNRHIPYFVYPHGMLAPWFRHAYPLKHLKKLLYWRWADYRVLRDASSVLFMSEEERIAARHSFIPYSAKEKVVPFGVGEPDVRDLSRQPFIWAPRLGTFPYLLFLGRIHRIKGVDNLLKAFSRVAHVQPELQLVIAGPDDQSLGKELNSLAATLGIDRRIHWVGQLGSVHKWQALASCEALVLPSHHENFGVVVAEALACSRPVILTRNVNVWREVLQHEAGFACEDNIESLAQALAQFLEVHPENAGELRSRARTCYEKEFCLSRAASQLHVIIQETIRDWN